MKYLAFESSCDETAAAVVCADGDRLRVLSNIVASQIGIHRLYGGVVPEIASRAHIEAISGVTRQALEAAELGPEQIDAVGVTASPGLIGALLVGVNFAKAFCVARHLPLVPVHHVQAHIAAAYLTADPPRPPFLALAVSGGNTAFYLCESYTAFRRLGGTRDDAMGEAFDKIGRRIGLPYPAGPAFDRLATEGFCRAAQCSDPDQAYRRFPKTGAAQDPAYHFPTPALTGSLSLSFSGLKTAAIQLLHQFAQHGKEPDRALFAAAYTYRAVEAVVGKTEELFAAYPGLPLVVAGGVAANSHLRRRLRVCADAHGVALTIPPPSLCGDNAAMVGAQTHYSYLAGIRAGSDLNARATD